MAEGGSIDLRTLDGASRLQPKVRFLLEYMLEYISNLG